MEIRDFTQRQMRIIIALSVFVVVAAIVGFFGQRGTTPGSAPVSGTPGPGVGGSTKQSQGTSYYSPVIPAGAALTKPTMSSPAAPGADESLGIFNMTASHAGFNPSTVTVKMGSVVQIRLTALDENYDFSMPYQGLYSSVAQGETHQIGFGATTVGTFEFFCRDLCPHGKIQGKVIIIP